MPILMKSILAAMIAAACVASAEAYSEHQNWTIDFVARIALAGTGDRCPRYRVINTAIVDELKSDGLTADDLHTKEFDDRLYMATVAAQVKYGSDPSKFCNAAWSLAGPDGTYRRQMLEAK